MGAQSAAVIWSILADLSLGLTALFALAIFISGLLILTGIGGQGIQKHVRGAILAIFMGGLFCFGANRMATKFASDFQGTGSATPTGAPNGAAPFKVVDVRIEQA